jgi:beta-aspartyl-peptidase (threonine type)
MTSRVPALIVHGGAGADPGGREELRGGMRDAVAAGWRALVEGGTALDAVEAAVRSLEDHPRFNAGRGSVLTAAGTVETDASIMEGDQLRNGAVAAVSGVRNPISLARQILEAGRHSFFAGPGALARARELGVPLCDPTELVTEHQRRRLAALQAGTVGAVALDRLGTIAAATSTGGMAGKQPGRVGDSALIRVTLGRRALDILKSVGEPGHACEVALSVLVEEGRGQGGLILVDWRGRVGWARSTILMPVGYMSPAHAEPELPF